MELQSDYLKNKRDMVAADNLNIGACVEFVMREMRFVTHSKRDDGAAPGMILYQRGDENKFAWIFSRDFEDQSVGWMDMDMGEEFRVNKNALGMTATSEKNIDKMGLPKLREFYSL